MIFLLKINKNRSNDDYHIFIIFNFDFSIFFFWDRLTHRTTKKKKFLFI